MKKYIPIILLSVLVWSCGQPSPTSQVKQELSVPQAFSDYWFGGQAELASYKLEQARYGEVHPGSAVLIFVTEDFSRAKQVKLDNPSSAGDDAWKVMKLNATRKFNTGIYPYSMMASTFTPIDLNDPSLLKATVSSQEWCGHTFSQVNNREGEVQFSLNSYFESEGDKNVTLQKELMEDELWTIIRLNPEKLPEGQIDIMPSLFYARLSHRPMQTEKAEAQIVASDSTSTFTLDYIEFNRKLSITFANDFPYQILSWEETSLSGFGPRAKN